MSDNDLQRCECALRFMDGGKVHPLCPMHGVPAIDMDRRWFGVAADPDADERLRADLAAVTEAERAAIREHRPPKPWERKRDSDVLTLVLAEYARLPEPRPDLPTWLNGATTALLLLRQVTA